MINITELLKDAPKGIKLYSPLFGEVEYSYIAGTRRRIWVCTKASMRMFSMDGRYCFTHNGNTIESTECLLFPSKECYTWEGWKTPIKPKFKVGDWITDGIFKVKITNIDNTYYWFSKSSILGEIESIDKKYHLWSIRDAKDGEVLVSGAGNPFIYNGNIQFSIAGAYIGVSRNGEIRLDMFPNNSWTSIKSVKPATKQECDLFSAKLREAGYQWDSKKKELKKIFKPKFKVGDEIKTGNTIETIAEVNFTTRSYICESGRTIWFENQDLWHLAPKPHYDIKNFKPFDKVLVRDCNHNVWRCSWFSHYNTKEVGYPFVTTSNTYKQCIPFNEDTKHLLGTTDMCPEEYINW